MPTENCLFCLEPVGTGDLAVPNLPCMCRTWQHDSCREHWNRMNPYKCPICRKTFTPEAEPVVRSVQGSIHAGIYNGFQLRNGPDPQFIVPSVSTQLVPPARQATPVQRPYPLYQEEPVYITIPSPPPSPSPSAPPSAPAQVPQLFQTQMTPQERRRFLFDTGCKAIACLGLMLILLVVMLVIKGM
jgi:hypothetical protein